MTKEEKLQVKRAMNKIIIGGVVYNTVEDTNSDCPKDCALSDVCNTSGASPCLLFGDKFHFEMDLLTKESRDMKMQKVVLDENVIPPMIHPYGAHWVQPNPKNIVLDKDYAMMSKKDFDLLPDYTCSQPTGKYNGKMWKGLLHVPKNDRWYLAWCHDENTVSQEIYISYREILIID